MNYATRTIVATFLAVFCASVAAGDFYRWVDDKGVVHYSDRASSKKAKATEVKPAPPGQPGKQAGDPGQVDSGDAPNRTTELRSEQCEKAKKRLNTYREADRLLLTAADGTQREMTPDEKIESILRAEKQTAAFCGESG